VIDRSRPAFYTNTIIHPVLGSVGDQRSWRKPRFTRSSEHPKQILKSSGTITGTVGKVYNDFWVEVKPKDGLADAYAPGANYKDKEFMATLKGLKKGDSVTITFNTDGERHRILKMRVNPSK
jgi:hypothetical protein